MSFDADFSEIYSQEIGRCTAALIRVLGNIDSAEEAVSEAFALAAERWPKTGIPPNPGGWVTTTARHRAIDRLRRDVRRPKRELEADYLDRGETTTVPSLGTIEILDDDQLRLIFLCCHPALSRDAQVALTLRLLGGLETSQIAKAFLVPETTMAQRLVRAKRKIRDNHMAFSLPGPDQLPARLPSVLAAVYLIFSEGHKASEGIALIRPELTHHAVALGRVLVDQLAYEPEAVGLLALMLLTSARQPGRISHDGQLVRLADQDRSLWDKSEIMEGHALVRSCLERNEPGKYQIQAAIAAVHADAVLAEDTDWRQIVSLYDHLLVFEANDLVRLNRAIAVGESDGAEAALKALAELKLSEFHLFHATRAEFLERLGRKGEADEALDRAMTLTTNQAELSHLANRRRALDV